MTILSGLNDPHGIVYHKGDLYLAEIHRIVKYSQIDDKLNQMPEPEVLNDSLPTESWHGYRILKIGPDEKLYVSIGMPCNTCNHRQDQPLLGTISSMTLEGKNLSPYSIGIRNSVGFA